MKTIKSFIKRIKIKKRFLERNKASSNHFFSKKSTGSRFNLKLNGRIKTFKHFKKVVNGIKFLKA